ADPALAPAQRALLPLADEEGFEVELQNGVLQIIFEEPAPAKFVVSPNAPVRQVWVSAMSRATSSPGRRPRLPSRSKARRSRRCWRVSYANSWALARAGAYRNDARAKSWRVSLG